MNPKRLVWAAPTWAAVMVIALLASLGAEYPAEAGLTNSTERAIRPQPSVTPIRLIFIHHSTGTAWLDDNWGKLALALRDNNYFVSDTNYGWGPDGIGDHTDLGNWWNWFRDAAHSPTYLAALYAESEQTGGYSRLSTNPGGTNEIILFKSCFPNSELDGPIDPPTTGNNPIYGKSAGDASYTVANVKGLYLDLLNYFATRPDKLFIVITAPPLMASATDAAHAANARALNNWLADANGWLKNYAGHNVAVFDYYNVLTGPDNHHRYNSGTGLIEHTTSANNTSYYPSGDSHPSAVGDQKATSEFLPLLNLYFQRWKPAWTPSQWLYLASLTR